MGRRYYRRNYSNYNNKKELLAISFIIMIVIVGAWNNYKEAINNFFNQYGQGIILTVVFLFIATLIIIKEIKGKNKESFSSNDTEKKEINLDTTKNQVIHNNYVLIKNSVTSNISPGINYPIIQNNIESEEFDNINVFLKKTFSKIFEDNEIYSISGFLRLLHPKIFEDLIERIFKLQGHEIIKRSTWRGSKGHRIANADGGIDLICKKDNKTKYIQIKNTVNGFISSGIVRDFDGATVRKKNTGDITMIITTTLFSDSAIKTAMNADILMVDYLKLNKIIFAIYENKTHKKILENFFIDNYYSKEEEYKKYNIECPRCGAPLKLRKEGFYGCQNYYKIGCSYIKKAKTNDVLKNITYNFFE